MINLTADPGRPLSPLNPRWPFWPLAPVSPGAPFAPCGPWGPYGVTWRGDKLVSLKQDLNGILLVQLNEVVSILPLCPGLQQLPEAQRGLVHPDHDTQTCDQNETLDSMGFNPYVSVGDTHVFSCFSWTASQANRPLSSL